jgi:hypothetical protein
MIVKSTLFDLFGDFTSQWPNEVLQEEVGLLGTAPNPTVWLTALNAGVDVVDIRLGSEGGRVSVQGKVAVDNARTGYSQGFPFVIASMPDVEFLIQDMTVMEATPFYVSVSDRGAEVVIEGLPVEIRLPSELIEPHPNPDDHPSGSAEYSRGKFGPGGLDKLKVIYRRNNSTSIFVHVRIHVNEEGEITVRPTVPISFEKCMFSGLPCKGIHDFTLIPHPNLVETDVEWIRHSVQPWQPNLVGPLVGLFAIRAIDFDETEEPFKDLAKWLNENSKKEEPTMEFVVNDLVMPFYAPYVLPLPHHITIGLRRRIIDPTDPKEIFSFDKPPIKAYFRRDPEIALIVNYLFYKSLPSEDIEENLGLTFEAGIVFADKSGPAAGEPKIDKHAIIFGLGENYTVYAGYQREFSSTTGLPDPGSGAAQVINAILHWEIATITVDIMAIRLGYAIGRAVAEKASFGDCAEATVDLFVHMPPTGEGVIKLRSLNGERVKFAIEGLGWRQGSFNISGVKFPDGMKLIIADKFSLIIEEIGLITEQSATYLSFSAGIMIEVPSGFKGGFGLKRMRFRVAGNKDAPPFKVDGFFLYIYTSVVKISAGGYYTEKTEGDTKIKEFGLTGQVQFEIKPTEYTIGFDLLIGSLKSPAESFDYFMFQLFFRGSITISWFELRGIRLLFANNMQPKLSEADKESQDLRYYNWYKKSNPLTVSGDRRLASWQAQKDAWGLGIGLSASFAGLGKICEFSIFVLGVAGPDENGFMFVGEVLLLSNPKGVGYLVVEWDGKNDRFSLLAGVELTIDKFLKDAPSWSKNIGKLTGTMFICNDPGTFAIGRLADEKTWLTLKFDFDLWLRAFVQFSYCMEFVEDGPNGIGYVQRIEGGINAGIVRVTYNAGFGIVMATFSTGSTDYALAIWVEAGLRIVLFRFLKFGLSARAEFRLVGSRPTRGELTAEIRLETPWFLPDVTWTFELVFGNLEPESLATAVNPLRVGSATEALTQKSAPVHVERFDLNWNGEGTANTFSMTELDAGGSTEAQRLTRFASNTEVIPLATDATIEIEWSVMVNDRLNIGTEVARGKGDQKSGDLTLEYEFVEIRIRRRPRFGSDTSWHTVEERVQLDADFSDPNGVDLDGVFEAEQISKYWDTDVTEAGKAVPKKLLINSKTPFSFRTKNPQADEEFVRDHPDWPCCEREQKYPRYTIHQLNFHEERIGADINTPRTFSESESRFNFTAPAYARLHLLSAPLPANTVVGHVVQYTGSIFRVELDEDAAVIAVQLAWRQSIGVLRLQAYDLDGNIVASKEVALNQSGNYQTIVMHGQGPIRRLVASVAGIPGLNKSVSHGLKQVASIEIDQLAYIELQEYLDVLVYDKECDADSSNFPDAYEGRGKVSFLPNHDYEIKVTTRVTVKHPSKAVPGVDVPEYLYFKTKGLPGLNAVERVGEEIESYVNNAYSGGHGLVYREEPVTLAFTDDYFVAVPLAVRPSGSSEEHTKLLEMQLLTMPDQASTDNMTYTSTGEDWIVANRSIVMIDEKVRKWKHAKSLSETIASGMISKDLFVLRLANITQRANANCPLDDPRNITGTVLIAPPQGSVDEDDPSKNLWPQRLSYQAIVRAKHAPFVDCQEFVSADKSAFDFSLNNSVGGSSHWRVEAESLKQTNSGRHFAIFGDADWNHIQAEVNFELTGQAAGLGVSIPAGGPVNFGLFVVVEKHSGNLRLAIYRRQSGTSWTSLQHADLPDEIDGSESIALTVFAYDDVLRAVIGETKVEVQRDAYRDGRMCLVADGDVAFNKLYVTGVDMYQFPFAVSRYKSFQDHIHSFGSTVDELEPNAFGPGSTSSDVGSVWAGTRTQVDSVMSADAAAKDRQALFDQWILDLGLALKDEVTELELSVFKQSNKAQLILLESPEPIDFSEEVTLRLQQRVRIPDAIAPFDISDRIKERLPRRIGRDVTIARSGRTIQPDCPAKRAEKIKKALEPEGLLNELDGKQLKGTLTDQIKLQDVSFAGNVISVDLELDKKDLSQRELVLVRVLQDIHGRHYEVYRCTIRPKANRGKVQAQANLTEVVLAESDTKSAVFPSDIQSAPAGSVFVLDGKLERILDCYRYHYVYYDIDVKVLQDSTAHRALIIPVSGSNHRKLQSGFYRLTFSLTRKRWTTTDPADDINQYSQTGTLTLNI